MYPHSLESHALTTLSHSLDTLRATHSARLHLLSSYAASKERAREAYLNKLAPGWNSKGGVMEPERRAQSARSPQAPMVAATPVVAEQPAEALLIGSDVGVGSQSAGGGGHAGLFDGIESLDSPTSSALL